MINAQSHSFCLFRAPDSVFDDPGGHPLTSAVLKDADLILALDPTLLPAPVQQENLEEMEEMEELDLYEALEGADLLDNPSEITQEAYCQAVSKLFQYLRQTAPQKPRHVAVCLMKADQLDFDPTGLTREQRWLKLETLFGESLRSMLENHPANWNIECFFVSSAGFLPGNGQRPNFQPQRGSLKSQDAWRPLNPHLPFFWLFDQYEHQRLAQAGSGLVRFFFQHREKEYIPYPGLSE